MSGVPELIRCYNPWTPGCWGCEVLSPSWGHEIQSLHIELWEHATSSSVTWRQAETRISKFMCEKERHMRKQRSVYQSKQGLKQLFSFDFLELAAKYNSDRYYQSDTTHHASLIDLLWTTVSSSRCRLVHLLFVCCFQAKLLRTSVDSSVSNSFISALSSGLLALRPVALPAVAQLYLGSFQVDYVEEPFSQLYHDLDSWQLGFERAWIPFSSFLSLVLLRHQFMVPQCHETLQTKSAGLCDE